MNKKKTLGDVILVVDDSPETLGMLNDTLDAAGMTTLVALDGKQALSIANQIVPDVILLDAIMPNMDGFETCRRIKSNPDLQFVPVIFMTGLSDTESIVTGFEAGGVDYLAKPINPKELIARMKVHLTNARATKNAESALDTAGQNVFTIDQAGMISWATPQLAQRLESLEPGGNWRGGLLAEQIRTWLVHKPANGDQLKWAANGSKLRITYLGESDGNKILMRLTDDQSEHYTDILKKAFPITNRESEVLSWIAKGKTNREIAQILEMSPRTVNKHLEQIFRKLEVDNRTSAATRAIEKMREFISDF